MAEKIYCIECGAANPSYGKFCMACGKPLVKGIDASAESAPPSDATATPRATSSAMAVRSSDDDDDDVGINTVRSPLAPVLPVPSPPMARTTVAPAPHLACPHCGQIDSVAKVSAIIAGGTTTGTLNMKGQSASIGRVAGRGAVSVGVSRHSGSTQSATVQSLRLSPPARPTFDTKPLIWVVIVTTIVTVAAGSGGSTYGAVVVGLIGGGIAIAVYWPRKKALDAEMSRWQEALRRWNYLFYCSRCDGVFDTSRAQRQFVPTAQMMGCLYSDTPVSNRLSP